MKFLLLFAIVFILFSCRKQTDSSTDDTPAGTNYPYDYILTKKVSGNVWSNGQTIEYFYNENNLVSEIKSVQWSAGDADYPRDTSYYADHYFLEYSGRLATKVFFDKRGSPNYWMYEYDSKGLPIKGTFYQTLYKQIGDSGSGNFEIIPDYPINFQTYVHDEKGNLIEKIDSAEGRLNFRYTYEYNDKNNLEKVTTYILWSDPQEKYKDEYLDYDDHVSIDKLIPGLPVAENFNIHVISLSSPNNPRHNRRYWTVKINEPFQTATGLSTTFDYNEAGFAIAEYFPGDDSFIINYEYKKIR
jgi:hypothetical protein